MMDYFSQYVMGGAPLGTKPHYYEGLQSP